MLEDNRGNISSVSYLPLSIVNHSAICAIKEKTKVEDLTAYYIAV